MCKPRFGRTHPEPELAVVIGKRANDIAAADAYDHVFGYTIHNDITSPTMRTEDSTANLFYKIPQVLEFLSGYLTLQPRLRELVICAVARLNGADYEFAQHAPEYRRAGGREAAFGTMHG